MADTVKNAAHNILKTATRLGRDSDGKITTKGKRVVDGDAVDCRMISVTGFQNQYKNDHNGPLYNKDGDKVIETAQGLNRTITMARKEVAKLMVVHGYSEADCAAKVIALAKAVVKVEGDINIGDPNLTKSQGAFDTFLTDLIK